MLKVWLALLSLLFFGEFSKAQEYKFQKPGWVDSLFSDIPQDSPNRLNLVKYTKVFLSGGAQGACDAKLKLYVKTLSDIRSFWLLELKLERDKSFLKQNRKLVGFIEDQLKTLSCVMRKLFVQCLPLLVSDSALNTKIETVFVSPKSTESENYEVAISRLLMNKLLYQATLPDSSKIKSNDKELIVKVKFTNDLHVKLLAKVRSLDQINLLRKYLAEHVKKLFQSEGAILTGLRKVNVIVSQSVDESVVIDDDEIVINIFWPVITILTNFFGQFGSKEVAEPIKLKALTLQAKISSLFYMYVGKGNKKDVLIKSADGHTYPSYIGFEIFSNIYSASNNWHVMQKPVFSKQEELLLKDVFKKIEGEPLTFDWLLNRQSEALEKLKKEYTALQALEFELLSKKAKKFTKEFLKDWLNNPYDFGFYIGKSRDMSFIKKVIAQGDREEKHKNDLLKCLDYGATNYVFFIKLADILKVSITMKDELL